MEAEHAGYTSKVPCFPTNSVKALKDDNNHFMAIISVSLCQVATVAKNWRSLLEQRFAASVNSD